MLANKRGKDETDTQQQGSESRTKICKIDKTDIELYKLEAAWFLSFLTSTGEKDITAPCYVDY